MFVDSHAHLEVEHFGLDQEQVIARAREAGVETILAIGTGTGPGSLDCAVQLAKRYAGIYATIMRNWGSSRGLRRSLPGGRLD